jgi:hypothetical protein
MEELLLQQWQVTARRNMERDGEAAQQPHHLLLDGLPRRRHGAIDVQQDRCVHVSV